MGCSPNMTKTNVQPVKRLILVDRPVNVKDMASDVQISISSIEMVIRGHLEYHKMAGS